MRFDDPAIIDRCRAPRHRGAPASFDAMATGNNPFCGDTLTMYLAAELRGGEPCVRSVAFEGHACSLCTATADLLAEWAVGRPVREVVDLTLGDLCRLWGGLEVGRAREGCVTLPATVLSRACRDMIGPD